MRIVAIIVGILAALAVLWGGLNPLELKLKAGLQVTTDDVPASLFLDGEYLDKAPYINQKIQPKDYLLRIVPDGSDLAPFELPITLHKGTITVVTWKPGASTETSGGIVYEMERVRSREATLEVRSVPDGAIVTLDGGEKHFSPTTFTLSEGNHALEISLPSYQTQQHSLNVPMSHTATVTVILGKLDGSRSAETASGSQPTNQQGSQENTPAPTDGSAAGATVRILPTNFFFQNAQVLRVRETPSPAGRELGFAPVGNRYPLLAEQTGWYQITFNGQPGWVSAQFSQKEATGSTQTAP